MVESSLVPATEPTKIQRKSLSVGASHCTSTFVIVAVAIWKTKTAAEWAAKAGVKERMVQYWLSGKYPVSADGREAILRELYRID